LDRVSTLQFEIFLIFCEAFPMMVVKDQFLPQKNETIQVHDYLTFLEISCQEYKIPMTSVGNRGAASRDVAMSRYIQLNNVPTSALSRCCICWIKFLTGKISSRKNILARTLHMTIMSWPGIEPATFRLSTLCLDDRLLHYCTSLWNSLGWLPGSTSLSNGR